MFRRLLFAPAPARSSPPAAARRGRRRPVDRRHDDPARATWRATSRRARKVTTLLAPNTDPHEYEVRPDDVKALALGRHRAALGRRGRRVARRRARQRGRGRAGRRRRRRRGRARGRRPALVAGPAAGREGRGRDRRGAAARGPAGGLGGVRAAPAGARRGRARVHGPRAGRRSASSSPATTRSATTRAATGSQVDRHRDPRADDRRAAVRGRGRDAGGDDQARGRQDDLRRELGQPEGRGGRSPARPARGSARRCGRTRSARRAPTARPTSARSSPTRARWSHGFTRRRGRLPRVDA